MLLLHAFAESTMSSMVQLFNHIDSGQSTLVCQISALSRRLLCGRNLAQQCLLLEAQRGAHTAAAGPLERHVAVLEH